MNETTTAFRFIHLAWYTVKGFCMIRIIAVAMLGISCFGQSNILVETIAGSGFYGLINGHGTNTMFNNPRCLTIDAETNIYVWDSANTAIRKISPAMQVTTLISGFLNSYEVTALCMQGSNILVASFNGLWSLSQQGIATKLNTLPITGICLGATNIFITLQSSYQVFRLEKLENGSTTIWAGSGNDAVTDGNGLFCSFKAPMELAMDSQGNLYVADWLCVRKVAPDRTVTTLALDTDLQSLAQGMTCDSNAVYIAVNNRIKRSFYGANTILAGSQTPGFADGEGSNARFDFATWPCGLTFGPDRRLYVADTFNHRIRRITFDQPITAPPMRLAMELKPVVTISGNVNQNYQIESRDSLAEPWTPVTIITLTNNPQFWLDSRPGLQRFYQAVQLP